MRSATMAGASFFVGQAVALLDLYGAVWLDVGVPRASQSSANPGAATRFLPRTYSVRGVIDAIRPLGAVFVLDNGLDTPADVIEPAPLT